MPFLAILWRFRYFIAGALLLAGIWWAVQSYGQRQHDAGDAEGRAAVTAEWKKDTARRDATDAAILAESAARIEAARTTNQEVLADANTKLIAIAGDRDSLAGRMRDYENRLRSLAASAATSERGVDVATGIARAAEEARRGIEERWDLYDKGCQRDAVRFSALQDEIRPQL